MKPKLFVLIALMLSILVAGIILILGYATRNLLPLYLLVFMLIFFAVNIFLLKNDLTNRIIIIGSIILVLIVISSTLFLTSLKTYYDVVNEYGNFENSVELNQMQLENDYYLAYAEYLDQRISEYKNQSKLMENQLAQLKNISMEQLQLQQNIPIIPIEEIVPTVSEVTYDTYYPERDYGEGEDD